MIVHFTLFGILIVDLLTDALTLLAGYSISVKDLQLLFSKLKSCDNEWPKYAPRLLKVVKFIPCFEILMK